MTYSYQWYLQQEWDYYDKNLGRALEAVEKGDLYHASVYFQRITWALRSLDKHRPQDRNHAVMTVKKDFRERMIP